VQLCRLRRAQCYADAGRLAEAVPLLDAAMAAALQVDEAAEMAVLLRSCGTR
jgi:hypothetical protein